MKSPIPLVKQASRVCAFCRQQQLRRISTTRIPQASSSTQSHQAQQTTTSLSPRPFVRLPHASSVAPRRFLASTARPEPNEPDTDAEPKVPQTHYDFFPKAVPDGPPPRGHFKIDVRALRREFLSLQASAHPDLHPSHMKSRAQATSARINEAFRTLESPLLRAQYILSLRGRDLANDEMARVEDPELLMLVLETRECIEEAQEEDDLEVLKTDNEVRVRECETRLERLFADDELDAAATEAVRLKYWMNIRESINNWEKGKPIVLQH